MLSYGKGEGEQRLPEGREIHSPSPRTRSRRRSGGKAGCIAPTTLITAAVLIDFSPYAGRSAKSFLTSSAH